MQSIDGILEFFKLVIFSTISQLVWLLGLLFVFGLILYLFARFTRITYVKSVGSKMDIIFTGWIGVPIHELGHAIFCIIFRHKITEMKLYTPSAENGALGYVNHAYNRNSTYQKIGNFFIGVGPIIFGALVLYAAFYHLVPSMSVIFASIEAHSQTLIDGVRGNYSGAFAAIWGSTKATLDGLLQVENFSDYRFWIFLYLAICISSHMQLSPPDIKGAKDGLISIVLFFLTMNLIILILEATGISTHFGTWWNYLKLENYSAGINKWVGMFGAIFVFASIISALNFVVSYIVLSTYNIIRGRGLINPAW